MKHHHFRDQAIILTGASSGIGEQLAYQLSDQGAWLSLAARSAEKLEAVAAACRARGGRAMAVVTDVSLPDQCRRLIDRTVEEYGRIDALINNAGAGMWARFDELQDLSVLDRIIRVNYLGAAYCTYYALPQLKKNRGRLVAVSSLAARNGVPLRSGYAAGKHAMTGFFETLRIELAGSGVTVTMIYPDFVATGWQARNFGADGKPLGYNPIQINRVMDTAVCARLTIKAMAERRRDVYLTLRGRLGRWLQLLAPGLVDQMALRAIEKGR